MHYYIKKPLKNHSNNYTFKTKSKNYNTKECNKYSRCNNPRTCRTCNAIAQNKIKAKLTNHIEESIIKSYDKKYFIRFKNDDLKISVEEKNILINLFMKDFIKMKRNKNFIINKKDEYIINKEISYSHDLGYNPHFHMILLSNNTFDINNLQFIELCNRYNISYHVEDIYTVKGTYKNSIIDIIGYINKYDEDTARLTSQSNILKNEKKNLTTNLFKKSKYNKSKANIFNKFLFSLSVNLCITFDKLSKSLYNKIIDRCNADLKEAKAIFKRNTIKTSPKNYLRMLKSFRKKKELINLRKSKAKAKLKA